jgi:muconolactone delta-isomerase
MKFLVIVEGVPGRPLPPEELLALGKAQWSWSDRQRAAGKAEVIYGLAEHAGGLMGGMGIFNYESAEELAVALATMPAAYSASVKVYPLVAPEVTERLIEAELGVIRKK